MTTRIGYADGVLAIDFSFPPHPTVDQLRAAGVTAVGRYVGPAGWSKTITQAEFDSYLAAGIAVWLVFEQDINNYQKGYAGGQADAQLALANLPSGYGGVIFAAIDTEVLDAQTALSYLSGFASVVGASRTGAYAQGDILVTAKAQGIIAKAWLSESTGFPGSNPPPPICDLIQTVAASPIPDSDLNYPQVTDFGQWPSPAHPTPAPRYPYINNALLLI